ncbi:MAG: S26 family signal peptidase, partial [Planctomycetales bacterium]
AFVLRAWVLEGLFIPVRIAGSSMAETFHGPHLDLTCDDCGYHFACDLEALDKLPTATCPNCGYRENRIAGSKLQPGDRLLINKTAYMLSAPQRWEAILFRCPAPRFGYCIKRVVGLPGETVTLRQGDVFVGSHRAKKTLDQLRRLAIPVFDASHRSSDPSLPARWMSEGSKSGWTISATAFHRQQVSRKDTTSEEWIRYRHWRSRQAGVVEQGPVSDDYGYNQTVSRQLNHVRDLFLVAEVTASGRGSLLFSIPSDGPPLRLQLDLEAGQGEVLCSEKSVSQFSLESDALIQGALIELAVADNQLLLAIDGESLLTFDLDDTSRTSDPIGYPEEQLDKKLWVASPVAIAAVGDLEVRFENVKLFRDIYYTSEPGEIPIELGEDEFYVLGDNSPISVDSRQGVIVKAEHVFGKPLRWP